MSDIEPNEFHALRDEVRELRRDVKDLVDAWKSAQSVVRVVRLMGNVAKWIAGVAASIAALWALLKIGFPK